jgi:hypothetical protein
MLTGSDGSYSFGSLQPGNYRISVVSIPDVTGDWSIVDFAGPGLDRLFAAYAWTWSPATRTVDVVVGAGAGSYDFTASNEAWMVVP